jgi:hypothetical protein
MRFFYNVPGFKNIGLGNILRNTFSKDEKESKKTLKIIWLLFRTRSCHVWRLPRKVRHIVHVGRPAENAAAQ